MTNYPVWSVYIGFMSSLGGAILIVLLLPCIRVVLYWFHFYVYGLRKRQQTMERKQRDPYMRRRKWEWETHR